MSRNSNNTYDGSAFGVAMIIMLGIGAAIFKFMDESVGFGLCIFFAVVVLIILVVGKRQTGSAF